MTANPRRDAWSAIRGFYYQIQLTVQRWLELGPHDELFCERGEDIEIISGALGNAPTVEQLLEQVKVRRSISLRSSESVSAVTRFFEARQLGARPTLFRFVTTGKASKEQGANVPRNLPGLVAWNAAKSRELDNAEIVRVAQQAKQLLRDAPRPTDITEKLATDFKACFDRLTPEDFTREFIDRIEWAINAEGVDSLRRDLSVSILASGRATTEPEASTLVDLLVAHVFRLLTQPGLKRLVARDVDHVLKQAALSTHEQRVLTLLESFSAQTAAQLSSLESKTDEILGLVSTSLQGTLTTLLSKVEGLTAQQFVSVPRIADDPLALEDWIAVRPTLIVQIGEVLSRQHAQILLGPTGMGKTTLAALIFRSWPNPSRHWSMP